MTPPSSRADYFPPGQIPAGDSAFNPSPTTPFARMSKARDLLASWAQHEAAAASGCDFGQCAAPDQATQDLLSQAKTLIVAEARRAHVTLDPETLLTPGAQSLPVSN